MIKRASVETLSQELVSLAIAYEDNLRAYTVAFAEEGGGCVRRTPEATCTSFPFTYWTNGIVSPRLRQADPVAGLNENLAWFRELGREVWVHAGPSSEPENLAMILKARGLHNYHNRPFMACDLSHLIAEYSIPEGVRISIVGDYGLFTDLPHPILGCPTTPRLRRIFGTMEKLAESDPRRHWELVAWKDQRPVGSGILFLDQGRAGIYDVEVIEPLRGQGIGTALLQEMCVFARDQGASLVSLAASERGAAFYPRFGFVQAGRWPTYYYSRAKQRRDADAAAPMLGVERDEAGHGRR